MMSDVKDLTQADTYVEQMEERTVTSFCKANPEVWREIDKGCPPSGASVVDLDECDQEVLLNATFRDTVKLTSATAEQGGSVVVDPIACHSAQHIQAIFHEWCTSLREFADALQWVEDNCGNATKIKDKTLSLVLEHQLFKVDQDDEASAPGEGISVSHCCFIHWDSFNCKQGRRVRIHTKGHQVVYAKPECKEEFKDVEFDYLVPDTCVKMRRFAASGPFVDVMPVQVVRVRDFHDARLRNSGEYASMEVLKCHGCGRLRAPTPSGKAAELVVAVECPCCLLFWHPVCADAVSDRLVNTAQDPFEADPAKEPFYGLICAALSSGSASSSNNPGEKLVAHILNKALVVHPLPPGSICNWCSACLGL